MISKRLARNGEYDRSSIYTYSLDSSRVTIVIRDHPDYEGDQKPGQRWFEQLHESRVTGWNRAIFYLLSAVVSGALS